LPEREVTTTAPSVGGKDREFPCGTCGAKLVFAPGTRHLACQYCGAENEIPEDGAAKVEEIDYAETLRKLGESHDAVERLTVHCDSCGATVEMAPSVTSQSCPFCGTPIVAEAVSQRLVRPRAILPFAVPEKSAREKFRSWLKSLWFAPTELKRFAGIEGKLGGLYLPYWTYDCRATTAYAGQRGDDYFVTVPFTVTVNGQRQVQMRQERRTRWSGASGVVRNAFDDVLVPASTSLDRSRLAGLGAWDLKNLTPYADEFLSGFRAESYTVDLPSGFETAKGIMRPTIEGTICADIGGDHQRISSMSPRYEGITFKHILMPIWVSAYRYRGKVYRFLVNGRTGEISGERPWSVWKIAMAVVAGLVVIGMIIAIAAGGK
jgi:DNA-directed RNA polymerase subunit RPC12/RpoP